MNGSIRPMADRRKGGRHNGTRHIGAYRRDLADD